VYRGRGPTLPQAQLALAALQALARTNPKYLRHPQNE